MSSIAIWIGASLGWKVTIDCYSGNSCGLEDFAGSLLADVDSSGLAFWSVSLRPLNCWNRGFESRWRCGYSSAVFVSMCSCPCNGLITRSEAFHRARARVCACVIHKPQQRGSLGPSRAVASQKEKDWNKTASTKYFYLTDGRY
jgi:hypothetical protein